MTKAPTLILQFKFLRNATALVALSLASCGGGNGASDEILTAPFDLKASPSGTDAHITWRYGAVGQATGIEVERKSTAGFVQLATIAVVEGQGSYHDAGTAAGSTYWYRVRAVGDRKTFSAYSDEVKFVVPAEGGAGAGGSDGGGSGGSGGAANAGTGGKGGTMGTGGSGGARSGGMGGTNAGGMGGTNAGGTSTPGVPSFAKDIAPKLEQGCGSGLSDCHHAGQADGRSAAEFACKVAWLSTVNAPLGGKFSAGPNKGKPTGCPDLSLYDRLTQIKSMLCVNKPQRQQYVVKGDPSKSLLYQVFTDNSSMGGTCQDPDTNGPMGRMPKAPLDTLGIWDAKAQKQLFDWIAAGAPNN